MKCNVMQCNVVWCLQWDAMWCDAMQSTKYRHGMVPVTLARARVHQCAAGDLCGVRESVAPFTCTQSDMGSVHSKSFDEAQSTNQWVRNQLFLQACSSNGKIASVSFFYRSSFMFFGFCSCQWFDGFCDEHSAFWLRLSSYFLFRL